MAKLEPFGWVFTPCMADAVTIQIESNPVVFCRDCKFRSVGENEVDAWDDCRLHHFSVGPDEHCSWGVLKDGIPPKDFEEVRKQMWMEVSEDA